jgi:hypothetical protein
VRVGQRGAHGRDHGLEAGLAQRDHVRVALDDDGAVLLRDRGTRQVQAVEDVALLEEVALGRVHVLAPQRVVLAQLARLEADDAPARVREREHQPPREVVAAALVDEARSPQLLLREPLLLRLAREARSRR